MIFFFLILYYLTPAFYPTYLLVLCFERKSCFSDVLKMYCVDLAAFLKNLNCLHTWSQDYRVADHNGGNIFWMRILMFFKVQFDPVCHLYNFKKNELSKKKHFSLLLKIWSLATKNSNGLWQFISPLFDFIRSYIGYFLKWKYLINFFNPLWIFC